MKKYIALLFACTFLGCGAGDGSGLDDRGRPISEQPAPDPTPEPDPTPDPMPEPDPTPEPDPEPTPDPEPEGLQPTLASIQENVLDQFCIECHAGGNAPAGLRMDNLETSTSNLIDVDSSSNSLFKRVNSGETAEQSFLFLKITGDPQAGARMPLGGPPLPEETIEVFRQWIENGAPINAQQMVVAQAKVVEDKQAESFTASIRFDQPVDLAFFNHTDIHFTEVTDNSQRTLDTSTLAFTWVTATELEITGITKKDEVKSLIIRLNQPGASSIYAQSGVWLDGDRNGYEGGEFVYEYQL